MCGEAFAGLEIVIIVFPSFDDDALPSNITLHMEPALVKTLLRPLVHLAKPHTKGLWLETECGPSANIAPFRSFEENKNILNKPLVPEILLKEG